MWVNNYNKGAKIKLETLKNSLDFKNLYKNGRHIDSFYFKLIVYVIDDFSNRVRIGYSINKKTAGAVIRNFIKRRIREIFRGLKKENTTSIDVLFIAKKNIAESGFSEIKDLIYGYMKDYLG